MTALEEGGDLRDLHLSLDCGETALKSHSRGSACRGDESSEHQMNHDSSDMLYLSRQELKVIPDYVCKYTSLKNLYLEGNELSILPDNLLSSLPHLLWLDLRNNQLTCLPANIGQHRCLKTLLLEGNPIIELPVELGNLITLRALSLRNCPISFPPQEVLQQGLAHILQFLRRTDLARRPLSMRCAHADMPAVERLALSEILQSSLDLSEVDDNEIERFKELRQRMIQLDRADLGPTKPVISPQHYLGAAEGDRFHSTQPPSMKRTQDSTRGLLPELPPSDLPNWKRAEEKRLAAMRRELKEKQAVLEQKRKNAELLQGWRNQAKIMQDRKMLEHKLDRNNIHQKQTNAADSSNNPNDTSEALNNNSHSKAQNTQQPSIRMRKETEETRAARDRELEQRIRFHVQMMQERRRRPRGSPAEEAEAAAQEMEEVKQLQAELAERRRVKHLEYRLSAFTGERGYDI
ncbi:LOW QUALITY PROTEIN: leucine-rich repeat-containing protein 27-like [Clarias gariepinus]|uniref:LOW QUALITY PROTEIN: leucine-rich repeat-containing protein 27-like n=1 Tax=Clarias gariepinus TaxID=13013 RepID=UPI00234CF0E2|nr:LOW QUALITY PROTEIN: leucine-rich repeat-containing protein 27-like [Clarias gariepinus]